jgi:hypothetical protein
VVGQPNTKSLGCRGQFAVNIPPKIARKAERQHIPQSAGGVCIRNTSPGKGTSATRSRIPITESPHGSVRWGQPRNLAHELDRILGRPNRSIHEFGAHKVVRRDPEICPGDRQPLPSQERGQITPP